MSLADDWRIRVVELNRAYDAVCADLVSAEARAVRLDGDLAIYRAFAVRLAEYTAPPDAEDMVAPHLAPCDLDTLAEHLTERIDTANRLERLDNRLRWTSLPEIPEHYETVEVCFRDDSRAFAWRDNDGGWHADGRSGIVDADIIGWRSIIP